jgi:galactose-1-phosphate uridylyltransferase
MWDRSAAFLAEHGVSYWDALVEQETTAGERFIHSQDGVTWLTPFAPLGGREVIAVVSGRTRVAELDEAQIGVLARGLSRVVTWYEREGLSAFNFTVYGGPSDPESGHPVVLRVIARSAFKPDYRTDDYFLQKQLGGELIFSPPEQIASLLRQDFVSA